MNSSVVYSVHVNHKLLASLRIWPRARYGLMSSLFETASVSAKVLSNASIREALVWNALAQRTHDLGILPVCGSWTHQTLVVALVRGYDVFDVEGLTSQVLVDQHPVPLALAGSWN